MSNDQLSDYDKFLKEMDEAGKELDRGPSVGFVGQMKIEFVWRGYVEDKGFWDYCKSYKAPDESKEAYASVVESMKLAGSEESPRKGLRVTFYKEGCLTKVPANDMSDWTQHWQEPAKMILEAASKGKLPLSEKFWGQMNYVPNRYNVSLGEAGKTAKDKDGNLTDPPSFPNVRVPTLAFKNKKEAQNWLSENGGSVNSSNEDDSYPFSDTAKSFYSEDPEMLISQKDEILASWEKVKAGEPYLDTPEYTDNFPPKPDPLTPPANIKWQAELKQYTATVWGIETSDLDVLAGEKIPF